MRPDPYFRPRGQRHRGLPYFAGYLTMMLGILAGLSSLGVDLRPLIVVPALIAALVLGVRATSGPPRALPPLTIPGSLALIVAGGFLLQHDEAFAPVLIIAGALFQRWVHGRPPMSESERLGVTAGDRDASEPGVIEPAHPIKTDGSELALPTPTPWSRPIGRRPRHIFLATRRIQLTLGLISFGSTALGVFVLYAAIFGSGPGLALVIAGLIGAVILLIGVAGLVTAILDLTRRMVVDARGLRLTNLGGWRFTWDEIAAVAIVLGDKRAPLAIAMALAPSAPRHISYATWDAVPPFTHLSPLRGDRDLRQLRRELADALESFVPDLYLGELTPPPP